MSNSALNDLRAPAAPIDPGPATRQFYVDALAVLDRQAVPYVVGGGYAMAYYTGIARNTKDLDIFVRPADEKRALRVLAQAGYRTEYFYPFWIAKALCGDAFIDNCINTTPPCATHMAVWCICSCR